MTTISVPTDAPLEPSSTLEHGATRLLPLLVFACVLLAGLHAMSAFPVGVFQDDGVYVVLAKSIATGEGYRYLHLPGAPVGTHYPPGYPALLALLWKLSPEFPRNVALFTLVNALLAAVGCAVAYRLAESRFGLPRAAAAAVAIVSGAGLPTLVTSGLVLSEPLFLALLFPALLAAERVADPAERPTVRRALLVGLLCGALILVRTIAIVIAPALVLALLVRAHRSGRLRAALATLLAWGAGLVAALLPWQLYKMRHEAALPAQLAGKYGSYGEWLLEGVREGGAEFGVAVVGRNLRELWWLVEMLFAAGTPGWWKPLAALVVTALFALGVVRALGRAPVSALFALGYLAIVILWPFPPARFFCAVWPLLLGLFALGVAEVWRWRPGTAPRAIAWHGARGARGAVLALSALVLIGHAVYFARGYAGRWWESIPRSRTPGAIAVVEWVVRHAAPNDVVVTDEETMVWLYTGRQAVPIARFTAAEYVRAPSGEQLAGDLRALLATYRPRWIMAGAVEGQRAAWTLHRTTPPSLRLVDTLSAGVSVFTPTDR